MGIEKELKLINMDCIILDFNKWCNNLLSMKKMIHFIDKLLNLNKIWNIYITYYSERNS